MRNKATKKQIPVVNIRKLTVSLLVLCLTVISLTLVTNSSKNSASAKSKPTTIKTPTAKKSTYNPYQKPLEDTVNNFGNKHSKNTGLYVADLSHNTKATFNDSRQFVSASLYKLFVGYLTLSAIDNNTIKYEDTVPDMNETVDFCLDVMITVSDNDCGMALGKLLGWENIDNRLKAEGYTKTVLDNYNSAGEITSDKLTTAKDVGTLLENLYYGKLLTKESTDHFMSLLEKQTLNYALPTGLDEDISFAHKTGLLSSVSHDAGFLKYKDQTLIAVMMTDGWENADAESIDEFSEFGRAMSLYMKTPH
ncbi:MAG: serine hydrolase [Micrococcaceae bacterium]